ncbi:MAG: glucose-6-phosphate isomerase [bacterium]|uniref:Glucose-6-phosphate isomerase n=1 Tax=Candidatus Aphodosoma intestinipullorum TaxID=2840674 RepID=A0A940DIH7_9BACT|nr:glucose-6-phosphate isomerase [Candidatus Aphodosoma intestinipullorum]
MRKDISLDLGKATAFAPEATLGAFAARTAECNDALHNGTGRGSDFLGWLNLPKSLTDAQLSEIEESARVLRENCEIVVVIGIGGSYLGAKAVIDALSGSFDWLEKDRKNPVVLYAGQNIGEDYIFELQQLLRGRRFGIICISKSGTTTEPALAFRLLKTQLEEQQGVDAARRLIVCVTDRSRGALRTLATQEGYRTFVIEDNVGGRYSVLTPVGLLPIAVAGFDIRALIAGAARMQELCADSVPYEENLAAQYAAVRNALYAGGKKIEILVNFHPRLHYFSEWWKQLYGESEGKEHKGIFPASVDFTTDLHSMGQWIQDGERTVFETVISVEKMRHEVRIPANDANLDGLNFLSGRRVDEVNKMAELGTMIAHVDGGVPNLKIVMPELDEYCLGQLIYFFEKACGISGYLLGINPFDQPGVEAYKKNMFALLGKPGYEKETDAIKKRL